MIYGIFKITCIHTLSEFENKNPLGTPLDSLKSLTISYILLLIKKLSVVCIHQMIVLKKINRNHVQGRARCE